MIPRVFCDGSRATLAGGQCRDGGTQDEPPRPLRGRREHAEGRVRPHRAEDGGGDVVGARAAFYNTVLFY